MFVIFGKTCKQYTMWGGKVQFLPENRLLQFCEQIKKPLQTACGYGKVYEDRFWVCHDTA